jgi:hypothetical protein
MDKEKVQVESDQGKSLSDSSGQAWETRSGNGTMIVGVSHRLAGMFARDEEECELPEDFKPRNDDYDWLGVD